MTCVVSLKTDGKIYMAADSAAIDDHSVSTVKDMKVFTVGNMLFGFAGSFRIGQLIRYGLVLPAHKNNKTDHEYMCTDFVRALQKTIASGGIDAKADMEASLLIAYNGEVYEIDSDFRVGIDSENFNAIGGGRDLAIGAMYAQHGGRHPEKRLTTALEAAAKYNAGVRAPFNILSI